MPCLAYRYLAFADTSPTLTPKGWVTTANRAAEAPLPLASPKQCMSILVMFSQWAMRGLGTVTPVGNPPSNFDSSLINSGRCVSHGIFSSQASQ